MEYQKGSKPMVPIKKKPILIHIMSHYAKWFKDFIIATGFKHEFIKNIFKKNKRLNIKIINTGINSMTEKD